MFKIAGGTYLFCGEENFKLDRNRMRRKSAKINKDFVKVSIEKKAKNLSVKLTWLECEHLVIQATHAKHQ